MISQSDVLRGIMESSPDTEGSAKEPSGFDAIALDERLRAAIDALGFDTPTAIQAQAIPALLQGRDVIGGARTGSGKTAAFGLPLLERVLEGGSNQALVLTPTRELAIQVGHALRSFAKRIRGLRIITIYGGAPYPPQLKALASGATVVVATPGRLIDHLERGSLDLSALQVLVLDEADEMLRMGFIDDVEKIIAATPETRQVALFSATMPQRIRAVAQKHLTDPVKIEVEGGGITVEHIEQHGLVVPQRFKLDALIRVLRGIAHGTTLIFARTRAGCAEVAERLLSEGFDIDALHGDLSQAARERVLRRMRARQLRIVVATDVAARGLDVEHIEHVINLDMPDDIEGYVHRIGRTGRAGRKGTAISFITPRERWRFRAIEGRLRTRIVEMQVPSDLEIATVQQAAFMTELQRAAAAEADAGHAFAKRACDTTGLDMEALARAALTLLADQQGISLKQPVDTGPPAWSRPPRGSKRPARPAAHGPRGAQDEPEVRLFFPLGRAKGVRPSDLLGLLANEAGLPGRAIGRIEVLAHKSFVSMPKSLAHHVLEVLPRAALRGIDVPIALERNGAERPKHQPGPHKPRRHPAETRRRPKPKKGKKGLHKPHKRRRK